VAARAAQGIGAALMSPAALAIVTTTFTGAERTRALGVWAAVGGSGAAIGVALGGLLTSGPGWQWVFFVNVPIGIVVALGVTRLMAPAATRERPRVDLAGAASVTTMFGALLIGLINAGDDGWTAPTTIVPLAVAIGAGVAFVLIERIVANPLVRLDRLAEAPLPGSLLMLLSAAGLLAGGFFLNTMYLQGVLGLTAFETGAAFIPVAVAIVVGAQAAAHLLARLGARAVGMVGFAIAAVGMLLLARIPVEGNVVVDVLPGFATSALGLGMVFVTGTTSAFSRVAHDDAGLVSGLTSTAHELGFAIGVAVISTVAAVSVGAPSGSIQGFSDAFLLAGAASIVAAVLAPWTLPASGQAIEGHAFAH
jgi:MFS family permease